jgi:hypothetical protein
VLRTTRFAVLRPLALGLLLVTVSCANDGRTLAPVDPHYTTTSTASSGASIGAPAGSESGSFLLSSDGFAPGSDLPIHFTCGGDSLSPPLSWGTPPGGVELAIVMRERSPQGEVHWIVTGIDPIILGFGEGGVPEGATQQVNANGVPGYLAPCPPPNTGLHNYDIVIHVLDQPLQVDPAEAAPDLAARIETLSTAQALLTSVIKT